MPKSTTKPSTPKLSDVARHVVAPKGVVSTGWPAVEAKCRELGISFRPWQPDVGRLILAKREDGKYAATIGGTGLSIPRQVGKTFLVGAIVFALCLLRPNLTVIWTAHRLRTAEETFGKMQAFAKRKRIAPHILKIVLGSGDEAIVFRNGSRILFGARERGFGRGFDEVDVLIFDEAQILTESALDDMIPATNQSRQATSALLLFMGTPPKPKDPVRSSLRMRSEALAGEDDDTGWVEFGADPGFTPTPLPAPLGARTGSRSRRPTRRIPEDTPREAILRMRKKLGPDSFNCVRASASMTTTTRGR
jgi:phage terminase large subunit-like protein